MHEAGMMRHVLRMVEEQRAAAGGGRVVSITLRVGALAAADPEHLRAHFVEEARGTIAEGAIVHFVVATDIFDGNAQDILLEELEITEDAGGTLDQPEQLARERK